MRPVRVTDVDLALLRAIGRERSVVAASRSVGMTRDRANYRTARLARAFGGPIVAGEKGGRSHGGSRLTPLGLRIARGGFNAMERAPGRTLPPNRFRGTYRASAAPSVELGGRLSLRVAFLAPNGSNVELRVDPEAILVARDRFPSSARNVFEGVVEGAGRRTGRGSVTLRVRAGGRRWRVAVTEEPLHELALAPGARVWLYVKATAVRRA